jgi:hypothetical protein
MEVTIALPCAPGKTTQKAFLLQPANHSQARLVPGSPTNLQAGLSGILGVAPELSGSIPRLTTPPKQFFAIRNQLGRTKVGSDASYFG